MITLIIDNSYSSIQGLSTDQHKQLSKLLSYTLNPTASYFSGSYRPRFISLLSKKDTFPTGLVHIVQKYIISNKIAYTILDRRNKPTNALDSISLKPIALTPYEEQIKAVEGCLKHNRGIVCAPTGFGKSITMALLINSLKLRTLIIVPNLELKRQLIKSFKDLFVSTDNITIENIDSRTLSNKKDYDCLIIDEAHHVAAKTYRELNKKCWVGIFHRFFFTATPFRSQNEEQLLFESIAGQVIYKVDYHTAVAKKYIVPMEAYYYELPRTPTNGTKWAQVYSDLVVNNDFRNKLIVDLLLSFKSNNKSVLCLVKEIKHGETLSETSGVHFASGINEDTEDLIKFFSLNKLNALIGTTGVLGEGVDTKPAEYIIIAGLGKSKNAFMQQVGRGFRNWPEKESCKIILFYDKHHKWPKAHFKEQCKFLLEEYSITPIKLDLD